jgi:hypothetical protein
MTGLTDARVRELLKEIRPADPAAVPVADLWPGVRARVDRPSGRLAAADWMLLTALALLCLLQPLALRMVLFHI